MSASTEAIRGYRYARAALSSLIGVGFLVAGLFQTTRGAAGSDLIWFIVMFVFSQVCAVWAYRRTREAADEERFDELLARREVRLAREREATGSVVGKPCGQCMQRIVVAHDGCRCAQCSIALHEDCKTAHVRLEHGNRIGAYR